MLSLFPQFLAYQFFSPFIIRILLGGFFIFFAFIKFKNITERSQLFYSLGIKPAKFWVIFLSVLEVILGIFLIIGFLTQLAAIISSLIMLGAIFTVGKVSKRYDLYIILLVISFSLILSGPGALAIDLPL